MMIFYISLALLTAGIAFLAKQLHTAKSTIQQLRRELEQVQCHEALSTLTGGIAHDFNNILGSIMGFSALLEDDLLSQPDSRELAQQITIAARRGQSIIRQLMNYSKKNMADGSQKRELLSLDTLVQENINLLKPSLHSARKIIYNNKAHDDTVVANATQIGQALLNLCINADHAIGVKTGTIEITLENEMIATPLKGLSVSGGTNGEDPITLVNGTLNPGNHICLSVKDDGAGMTLETAKHIFDPFFTTKDVNAGTGLGLPAVQGIVHGHGGTIIMTSKHFHGTTFSLLFPIGTAEAARAARQAEKVSQ